MKSTLYRQLERYCSFGPYPFHMPGHKRSLCPQEGLPYEWDLTEVEGTDDLHEAEGILRAAMDRTAAVFGAARTWYLIGGSTCGLLSGIRALAPAGSRIIAGRNCHKSVCNAIELGGLQVSWILPPMLREGVCGSISPQQIAEAVEENPDAACVVITSPTYEGVISDIRSIAEICHKKNIPLLVDEAHGAHLGLAENWPDSALHQGADVVIQSVHKTLPSLTQTALLHLGKGSLADPGEVERQLGIFETSSPSYPLMVSIDACTELIAAEGKNLFSQWRQRLDAFDHAAEKLVHLRVLGHCGGKRENIFSFDPGKIPIFTGNTEISGHDLAEILRNRYGLETEMSQGEICLVMTGMGDSDRAMQHLQQALLEIDSQLSCCRKEPAATLLKPGKAVLGISEAVLRKTEKISLSEAAGRISGEAVWAYPPGIPLILPGEQITEEFLSDAEKLRNSGTNLHHGRCSCQGFLAVLKET